VRQQPIRTVCIHCYEALQDKSLYAQCGWGSLEEAHQEIPHPTPPTFPPLMPPLPPLTPPPPPIVSEGEPGWIRAKAVVQ